jgi:hypothetical protein
VTYKASYFSFSFLFIESEFGDECMHPLRRNKKGLSVVVTTLIILVVAVLLATIVVLYAVNVTTTRVQEEALQLTKQHIWFNTTGSWAQAAIMIINTGGRDVVLDKISVRGQECPWANVYYWRTDNETISDDLGVTPTNITGLSFGIQVQGQTRTFQQAGNDLTLKSGWTIVIYIMNPDSISLNDVGMTVGITAFTSNAQYYKETNIEAAQ